MKIFISQPMHGKTEKEIMERRTEIYNLVYHAFPNRTIDFIDQISYNEGQISRVAMLGRSLQLMAEADLVIMDKADYRENPGCYIESYVVDLYKIPNLNICELEKLAELPND